MAESRRDAKVEGDVNDRERDAIAAVKLHGWRWIAFNTAYGRVRVLLSPETVTKAAPSWPARHELCVSDATGSEPIEQQHCDPLPHYHTDASDDYRTLVVVRTWDGKRQAAFAHHLIELWMQRGSGAAACFVAVAYEPGDYTTAALAVLESEEPK
jgi:hypothetical protein